MQRDCEASILTYPERLPTLIPSATQYDFVPMAGPPVSRLPQPSMELKKLNLSGYTTKMVQATLASAENIPRTTAIKSRPRLQDAAPESNLLSRPRDEIFCPNYCSDDQIRHEIICSLNPNVDRAHAVLGNEDPAKVCIMLYKPPFGTAGEPLNLQYPVEVRWERDSSIRSLNRWRAAIFLHYMGLELEKAPEWHELEIEFVTKACAVRQEQAGSKLFLRNKSSRLYSWQAMAEDYNACFSGRKLPGFKEPRPARKRTDLVAQNCRTQRAASPFRCPTSEYRKVARTKGTSEVSPQISSLPRAGPNLASKVYEESQHASSGIPKPVSKRSTSG